MDIISRDEALARGLGYYFDGSACSHGHRSPKFVRVAHCVECMYQRLHNRSHTPDDLVNIQTKYEADKARRIAVAEARTKRIVSRTPYAVKTKLERQRRTQQSVDATKASKLVDPRAVNLWRKAKDLAMAQRIPFKITPGDIAVVERCPVLDLALYYGRGAPSLCTPVLERIDHTKGYIPGNVLVVSRSAKMLKNDQPIPELHRVSEFYVKLLAEIRLHSGQVDK